MGAMVDIKGQHFGHLTALRANGRKSGRVQWLCECDLCGGKTTIDGRRLLYGIVQDCGCVKRDKEKREQEKRLNGFYREDESVKKSFMLLNGEAPDVVAKVGTKVGDPYENLANAIVAVAAEDYKFALKKKDENLKNVLENFFHSEWYKTLCPLDPDFILDNVAKEAKNSTTLYS